MLLQAAALGDIPRIQAQLLKNPPLAQFRDYDRRTALHVAASEGHLAVVQLLVERYRVPINRSDRWGGSPLDDAHRHRHANVVQYLRSRGGSTGNADYTTNFITAAANGDLEEVQMFLTPVLYNATTLDSPSTSGKATFGLKHRMDSILSTMDNILTLSNSANKDSALGASGGAGGGINAMRMTRIGSSLNMSASQLNRSNSTVVPVPSVDINAGDYDKRTALHVAASQGHTHVVEFLCLKGANVNIEDKMGTRPIDDAMRFKHDACVEILKRCGAVPSATMIQQQQSSLHRISMTEEDDKPVIDQEDNLRVEFTELEMIDKIGAGAFGEIFKCRWRGTLVAAKCIKSAKIVSMWKKDLGGSDRGAKSNEDERDRNKAMTEDEMDTALEDFRQETMILRSLRHPNICMLLAYSTTQNYEVMISELMKCSLWDIL